MGRRKGLLRRLYPTYVLIVVISLAVVTWYASSEFKDLFLDRTAADLKARALLMKAPILARLDPLDAEAIDAFCKRTGIDSETRITVILPSGQVVGDSYEDPEKMDTHLDRPEVLDAFQGGSGVSVRTSRTLGNKLIYVALPISLGGSTAAVIRASIPISIVDEAIRTVQMRVALAGLAIALLAGILSAGVARGIAHPLSQLKDWAESVARGRLHSRPPPTRSKEIAALSDAMTRMASELQDRVETVLRQGNEMEAVLTSMVEGVVAVDREGRILRINPAASEIFGCGAMKVEGRSIHEVIRNTEFQNFVFETLSGESPVEGEIAVSSEGGRVLYAHGTLLRDPKGSLLGALLVVNDVTQLRRLEGIRREFVANVSHEIRTPLTAIKAAVETLEQESAPDNEGRGRFLGIVSKHVDRLEAIIEDLLRLSSIEQDEEERKIRLVEERLRPRLETAIEVCNTLAEQKGIRVELQCPEELAAHINAPLLEQAVVNLLDNAVKYSEGGGTVHVRAAVHGGEIVVDVRDQGPGITKEHLPRLFERFYRVDKARSRKLGGTGLGLAIVKHVVQAHGGRMKVESAPGKGSTFSICLPLP